MFYSFYNLLLISIYIYNILLLKIYEDIIEFKWPHFFESHLKINRSWFQKNNVLYSKLNDEFSVNNRNYNLEQNNKIIILQNNYLNILKYKINKYKLFKFLNILFIKIFI